MSWEYSEDNLVEQTAIDFVHDRCGCGTAIACNKETFGAASSLAEEVKRKLFSTEIS